VSTTAFAHEALFYAGDDGFLEGTLPFIREGLDSGEPTLLVLGAAKLELVRSELNGDGGRVLFADMADVGANPARIIPAWRRFVDEHGANGRPVRGIGEPIWPERSADELVECQRHEALLNVAFAYAPAFRLLCPYGVDALDADVLDEAARNHPYLVADGARRASSTYRGLFALAAPFAEPLPPPPASARVLAYAGESLVAVRELVAARAAEAGLDRERGRDLVLAVNEVATNSVRHGGGSGTMRVWADARSLVCELEDEGRIVDPLAGRREPRPGQEHGRGLWIANQVCDLVQVRTFETRSVVRLHVRR
jgi:anti-sigma regulatory factor (Ser/Thr protein kinase)